MEDVSRRTLIQAGTGLALAAAPGVALAQGAAPAAALDGGRETVALWPGRPPGAGGAPPVPAVKDHGHDPAKPDRWVTGVAVPHLVVCRPTRPNGAAVLLFPGGGYGFLSYDNEGLEQARWLNALGITAFVVMYRLPGEGWADRADVPLQDAQRAVRLVRGGAARFGIDPARVAVIGFSAGGHLAGSVATRHGDPVYAPVDEADRLSARPDLAALIYPVVSLSEGYSHGGSRDALLGPGASPDAARRRSVEQRVSGDMPPLFIVHAADDDTVPVENSLMLYRALVVGKRLGELHVFEEGGHGFGVRLAPALPASAWPRLFTAYATRKGVLPLA